VLKVPPRIGFGESLNVLHRTAQQCGDGDYMTSKPRKVDLDEWMRFGFKDANAAYQFRAEAERIAPDFVEPPDAEWQR
jgi:hypothetical protein